MKKIIYTCDACQKRLPKEPEEIFTFPVYQGYRDMGGLSIAASDKIQTKKIMLCSNCERHIANFLLDRGIVSE